MSLQVTCLAIGDPHFTEKNVVEAEELIDKINRLVKAKKPDFVVILGDLLHTHEKIHVLAYQTATKLIYTLSRKVPVYVIIGNHDMINASQFLTNNHGFNAFKRVENVTVCDTVFTDRIKGHKFVFCPYVPPGRFVEALDTLFENYERWDDATCIFAHQEFYGCSYNPTIKSTDGDLWDEDNPLVVSGHIHGKAWLQSNIYYAGSTMQHAFGESADKTIALLTWNKREKVSLQEIDLEMRKKVIVYLDIENADTFVERGNAVVKLVLKGRPEQIKVFKRGQIYRDLRKKVKMLSFTNQENIPMDESREKPEKENVLDILEKLIENENNYVKAAFDELLEI